MESLRLAFAGTPEFAVPGLQSLVDAGHRIVGVWTQPDRAAGRGRQLRASPVKQRALELGLPIHQPAGLRDLDEQRALAGLRADAMVVAAYGLILPPAVLALPRLGCFNIHASLLPRWRGAAPIQRAILAGDRETGITIMRMDAGLDTGPLLATERLPIEADDTAQSLQDKLARLGARLMAGALEDISEHRAQESAQPADGATYAQKIHKSAAQIDWTQPAVSLERQVRAFNPWPVAETHFQGAQLRIWESQLGGENAHTAEPGRIVAASDAGIDVACGSGVLRIRRLQAPGRSAVPAGEFLRSRKLLGARLGAS